MLKTMMAAALIVVGLDAAHALERNNRGVTAGGNVYGNSNPCVADTQSLCPQAVGNRPAAIACLKSKMSSLSPGCRARFGK